MRASGKISKKRFDSSAEERILGNVVSPTGSVQVALDAVAVKRHDAKPLGARNLRIEVLVWRQFIEIRKHEGSEKCRPCIEQKVLVLFSVEKAEGVNFQLAKGEGVEAPQRFFADVAKQRVRAGHQREDPALRDGGHQINVGHPHSGKCGFVAHERPLHKGRAAAKVRHNEERLLDWLFPVSGEEDFVQHEADPGEKRDASPNWIKQQQENKPVTVERAVGAGASIERTYRQAPEQAKVEDHRAVQSPCAKLQSCTGICMRAISPFASQMSCVHSAMFLDAVSTTISGRCGRCQGRACEAKPDESSRRTHPESGGLSGDELQGKQEVRRGYQCR